MRAKIWTVFFLIVYASGQDVYDVTEEVLKLMQVCDKCTCSEIPEIDDAHLVLNILCSEVDKIQSLADLDKIAWPPNPNGLNISATFEGLGLSTLGKLPPNSQVETLRFTNNAIKVYWPDPFSDVPNLKKLSFYQNELTEITPDLFTNIEGLEDLDLSFNKLIDFNSLDFKHLHNVKKLNLQSNHLKRIPVDALIHMKTLEDLDMSKNSIYDLMLHKSDGVTLSGLKRLYLSGNRIRSVMKNSFPSDNSIELLDLSNNLIEIVEENAFLQCSNLRELNLAQNNITFVFALPPSLQIAILKLNTLYHWPDFPSGIKYIDLSYNRLTDFYDESRVSFDNLEVLNVGGNQIKDLAMEKKLPNLFILDLSYNSLSEVPKDLNSQTLPNLEDLHLDGNIFENIYFKNIIAVKSLYMNELTRLRVVEEKAFSNVVGRDETGDLGCFSLSLSNCPSLSEIKVGAFAGTSLCMLDISKNNLTYISPGAVEWARAVEGVDLQGNPWRCECRLQWLLDSLLPLLYRGHSRLLADLRCGSPRGLEGLRLVHWYNWTEKAMCDDSYLRAHNTYMMEPSSERGPQVSSTTLIIGACIIVGLLVAIALSVYLVKTRHRHNARQKALKRKRQSAADVKDANGMQKEQFSALNKA